MKTPDPTTDDILNDYFNQGQCTITFKNGQILVGIFTNSPYKPDKIKIIGWYFNYLPDKITILIYQDEIKEIENAIQPNDPNTLPQ
jgi:hypothetical protein